MDISFVTGLLRNKLLTTLNALATNITVKNTTDIYIQAESINLEKILTLLALQTNFKLRTLIDIAVLDFPYNTKNRFQCIYLLASWKFINRLYVQVPYKEGQINTSITSVFTCAEWYEREAWDLYGLWFENHPNLRRILNDYGYRDYPFRKDYPLNGYIQVQYNSILNSVIIHKLTSLQEFRVWDFQSPWIPEMISENKTKITKTFNTEILDNLTEIEKTMEKPDKEAIIQYISSTKETDDIYEEDIWELTTFTKDVEEIDDIYFQEYHVSLSDENNISTQNENKIYYEDDEYEVTIFTMDPQVENKDINILEHYTEKLIYEDDEFEVTMFTVNPINL